MPLRLLISILTLLCTGLMARADDTTPSGHWRMKCNDVQGCRIVTRGMGPNGEEAILALRRLPGSDSRWHILTTPLAPLIDLTHPFAIGVDGGPKLTFNPGYDFRAYESADSLYLINEGLADRLLEALMAGRAATLYYEPAGGGSAVVLFKLDGLSAGLDWIDTQQRRTDGDRQVTAPTRLRPHASMNDIRAPVDGGDGRVGLPEGVLARHYGVQGCEDMNSSLLAATAPLIARLSDTALLFGLPCTRSGAVTRYRLYVVETGEIGGIESLSFARFSSAYGWTGTQALANIRFDEEAGELIAQSTAADLDGCGYYGRWKWQDIRFALVEYRYRDTCTGASNPTAWPQAYSAPR